VEDLLAIAGFNEGFAFGAAGEKGQHRQRAGTKNESAQPRFN
jgi:hypothetical protein